MAKGYSRASGWRAIRRKLQGRSSKLKGRIKNQGPTEVLSFWSLVLSLSFVLGAFLSSGLSAVIDVWQRRGAMARTAHLQVLQPLARKVADREETRGGTRASTVGKASLPASSGGIPAARFRGGTPPGGTGNTGQGCPVNWQARMPAPPAMRGRQAACKKMRHPVMHAVTAFW